MAKSNTDALMIRHRETGEIKRKDYGGTGVAAFVEPSRRSMAQSNFGPDWELVPATPEERAKDAQIRIDAEHRSSAHKLAVMLDPMTHFKKAEAAGQRRALRRGFDGWLEDWRGMAQATLDQLEQAKRDLAAARLEIVLRDHADEISHVSHRPVGGPMSERKIIVYKREAKSPTGCWGYFGAFQICDETLAVLARFGRAAQRGGMRGHSTVGV